MLRPLHQHIWLTKMINYIQQDITTVDQGVVAHGCNCQGVMGAGVALAIRNKWPKAYDAYAHLCKTYENTSDMLGVAHFVTVEKDRHGAAVIVANLFTQLNFGSDGKAYANLDAITSTLDEVVRLAMKAELPVYLPRIGCGLGGLDWGTQVGPIVEALAVKYSNVDINVCDL
ncbi:hypothetical protein E4H12_04125 [Candidatus Thorarchaeota archaeon]|nr:MAG: hypothetical protein E4H12_04125 [Candidatus Thorarchaeota archaeon]